MIANVPELNQLKKALEYEIKIWIKVLEREKDPNIKFTNQQDDKVVEEVVKKLKSALKLVDKGLILCEER